MKTELEEVAERIYPENWQSIMDGQHDSNSYERTAFINGAKWQQERMYSQDEILMAMGYAIGVSGRGSLSHEEVKSSCIDFIEALNKK